ncbi:MAG: hypothetical protein KDD51_16750, partial [Bdellovibrionales bacterium]|nr:hypothetical protein [Bdellovibrionales bacterium]
YADTIEPQIAPALEDKFNAISNGSGTTTNISITTLNAIPASATSIEPTSQVSATEEPKAASRSIASQGAPANLNTSESKEEGLTLEDFVKALFGVEETPQEDLALEETYAEGPLDEIENDAALGKQIPLVLHPGKLRALQRGLSGVIDKPTQIGTRTGNGRRDEDTIFTAGEKLPLLRSLFGEGDSNPPLTLYLWLAIAFALYFVLRSLMRISNPKPSAATRSAMVSRFPVAHAMAVSIEDTAAEEVPGTLAPWTQSGLVVLEPNKMYIKLNESSGKWHLVRTNFEGIVAETLAELLPGTVVAGKLLGPEFTGKFYKLKHNGKWAHTVATRMQFVLSVANKSEKKWAR